MISFVSQSIIVVLVLCIKSGHSYPKGAPVGACADMTPHHGDHTPKTCQPNYIIESDKNEFSPNDEIRITVRGATSEDLFKGILLIAKDKKSEKILGTWSTSDSLIQTISCDKIDSTGITHKSSKEKSKVQAVWHAPSGVLDGPIIVKATIVKSYKEIYVDCYNVTLTPRQKTEPSIDTKAAVLTNAIVQWYYAAEIVTVTMTIDQVKLGDWRGIGFSLDQEMGDEYVFVCQVQSSGTIVLTRMQTKLGQTRPLDAIEEANVISTTFNNGRLMCQFSFKTNSTQADGEPAPLAKAKNYYLLFAAGILLPDNTLRQHDSTFVTPNTYQVQINQTINLDSPATTPTPGTGSTIVTTTTTTTTVAPSSQIGMHVNWTYIGGVTNFRMLINNLKASQWVALGLSLDEDMGDDHVFICQQLSNNSVVLARYVNPGGHTPPVITTADSSVGGIFNLSRQEINNGVATFEFTLSNFGSTGRRRRQAGVTPLSQTNSYHPLIAFGLLSSSNTLTRHTTRLAQDNLIQLNKAGSVAYNIATTSNDRSGLMKAHGIIMIFTWILFVSTGILIARYFKLAWSDRKLCGKAVWFAMHRTIMSTAALLTLVSFVLILVYLKGTWVPRSSTREFAHSIVGILVISFAVIQPFMALFRCNPKDKYRFIFNYAHMAVGLSAFILSIVAIFLAFFFEQFNFQMQKQWGILVAYSCWIFVIFLTFEFIEFYFRNDNHVTQQVKTDSIAMQNTGDGSQKVDETIIITNHFKDKIKGVILIFHILVVLGLALALAILIGQSDS